MAFLEVKHVSKRFGGLTVLNDISFEVKKGEIVGLIGPNGAGKTTMFNIISGLFPPTSGEIIFEGNNITGKPINQVAKMGIVRTFQTPTVWPTKVMMDNVRIGLHTRSKVKFLESFLGLPSAHKHKLEEEKEAMELLKFMGLGEMAYQMGANQSYGRRRGLGIAVALAVKPRLLLLDEPVTGMMASETRRMMDRIRRIRDDLGVTVLVVEHHMKFVMGLCERIVALNFGVKLAEGTPDYITSHQAVVDAYLGVD
ncbi:MAG: ABC transporter ATP-binding protein [Chloroflexi bacterium]|nr:ABC transporter ATP-binding protein [Chloroflexota bacterium]